MTPITLKTYQQAALDTLAGFARTARLQGAAQAFASLAGRPYQADAFGEVPCVCLRVPTGGGKTVLAAHAVPLLARAWAAVDAPVAVWLVPSDAIRTQTLKALQTPGHPYRAALADAYGEGLRVCALEDVAQIAAPEWGRNAVVVVATIQSFRVEDAGQRNVYSFSESFRAAFQGRGRSRPGVPAESARRAGGARGCGARHHGRAGGLCGAATLEPGQLAGAAPAPGDRGRGAQHQDGQELHGAATAEPLVHSGADGHTDCRQDQCAVPRERAGTGRRGHDQAAHRAGRAPRGLARRRVWRGADATQAGSRGAQGRSRRPWLCATHRALSGAERGGRDAAREAAQLSGE
jgi:hypothetical protein